MSQIINHLLALDPARPFDFLIEDELLRLSLHQHLAAKELSTETVLEIEYVPAVLPPTPKEEHPHDDWISAIAVLPTTHRLVTGCYDGVVRLWQDGDTVASFAAHKGAVKAAAVVSTASQLITTGADGVARVWETSSVSSAPELMAVLKGHTASVDAVAVSPDGERCVTGGWDGQIFMWRAGEVLAEAVVAGSEHSTTASKQKKKRKVEKGGGGGGGGGSTGGVPTGAHEEQPIDCLQGTGRQSANQHQQQQQNQCVSALSWVSSTALVSASWDHSIRVWDPEVSAVLDTFSHNKAVHCVATQSSSSSSSSNSDAESASVIAFGGPDKTVRVWDRRANNSKEGLAVHGLNSHTDWVSALAWHPTSAHHLLSASYDKTAKLWDLRAAVPLHTLPAAGERLLSCCWVGGGEIAYGGADNVLRTAAVDL